MNIFDKVGIATRGKGIGVAEWVVVLTCVLAVLYVVQNEPKWAANANL